MVVDLGILQGSKNCVVEILEILSTLLRFDIVKNMKFQSWIQTNRLGRIVYSSSK
jgi:hypothetical protein